MTSNLRGRSTIFCTLLVFVSCLCAIALVGNQFGFSLQYEPAQLRPTCGIYWKFVLYDVRFIVPFKTCGGRFILWHISFPYPPESSFILSAATENQLSMQGPLVSSQTSAEHITAGVNTKGLHIVLENRSLLAAAVLDVTRNMMSNPCVSYRSTGQYAFGEHVLDRALEYSAFSLAHDGTSKLKTKKTFVIFPALVAWDAENVTTAKNFASSAKEVLRDLHLGGAAAVFVTSRAQIDLRWAHWRSFKNPFFTDPVLSLGIFLSQESLPDFCGWQLPRSQYQLDGPYVSSLHSKFHDTSCLVKRKSFLNSSALASSRPIKIFLAAGARSHIPIRQMLRNHVLNCSQNSSKPYGSCAFLDLSNPVEIDNPINLTMSLYGVSTFCIQPRGDTPMRRGFYDSILMGCIPVTLSPTSRMNQSNTGSCDSPWHFANDVMLPFYDALNDIYMSLNEINTGAFIDRLINMDSKKIEAIQQALAKVARGVQYRDPLSAAPIDDILQNGKYDAVDLVFSSIANGYAYSRR